MTRDLLPLALSAGDIGVLFGVSQREIYVWHSSGILGPVPVTLSRRVTRWDAQEIRDWWAACRAAGRKIERLEWLRMRAGAANG